jgi:DNA-binding SARP family transcriptional activator/predicted ATPase
MGLKINLLGSFRIAYHNQLLYTIDQPREQSLLAYLLFNTGTPVSRRYLAYLYWPDSTDAQARNNLRQVLHQLRRALPQDEEYIYSDTNKLYWRPESNFHLDVFEFEKALKLADSADKSGDLTVARTALGEALNLYRGDLLLSCYDDWILTERERLHQLCLKTLERIIQILEEQRDYKTAIPFAQRLIRHDRLYEDGYRLLMRLYAISNERASALRTYHTCVDILQNELGVEPEPATREIFHRLRSAQVLLSAASPDVESVAVLPLTGRSSVWAQLQAEWQRADAGEQRFVLLSGEAGIGKSRLAEELLQWVARQGFSTAKSRAYAAEGSLSYSPLVDWLRSEACRISISRLDKIWLSEVARLLPGLLTESPDIPAPEPLNEHWQRQKFYQALAHAILGMRQPLLLLLDDLQWCDPEMLEWLHYLLRADPQACLLLIGTLRLEDLAANQALKALLFDLRRNDQLTEILLEPLDETETARLAKYTAGLELDSSMALRLFQETEGNPLFLIETIRAGFLDREYLSDVQEEAKVKPDSTTLNTKEVPEKVRAVISGRLAHLSVPARKLAYLAATVGRSFSIEVLMQASDASEEDLLDWLDELWQRRIIHLLDENTYDFTHDKLRQVAYGEVSLPRRRLLHLRVARAQEIVHASNLDPFFGQLGFHFEQANKHEHAIRYYYLAAQVAQRINANQEAISLLRRALALLETLPEGNERYTRELDLQTTLGVSLINTLGHGNPEVIQTYDRALALNHRLNQPSTPPILRGRITNHILQAEFQQALGYSKELIHLAEHQEDRLLMVEANYAMGVTTFWLGNFQPSRDYLERAIALYDPQDSRTHISLYSQNPKVICQSRMAFNLWCLGYPSQAIEASQLALEYAHELAHPFSLAYTSFWNVLLLIHMRMFPVAIERVVSLINLCQENQVRHFLLGSKILKGYLLAEQGGIEAGITRIRDDMERFREGGAELLRPLFLSLLAEFLGRQGNFQQGTALLNEVRGLMEKSEERWCESEILRRQGELFLKQSDTRRAEEAFIQAIKIARNQGARMLELRAALGLGRMWLRQGKYEQVKSTIEPLYQWFQEGLDSPDLQTARHLLEEVDRVSGNSDKYSP